MTFPLKPLKHIASLNDDVLGEDTSADMPVRYAEVSDVSQGETIRWKDSMPFGQVPSRARRLVRHGDILVSTVRTYLRAVARVEQPPEGAVVSTGLAVIRPETGDPRYLGYVLQADDFIDQVVSRSVGVSYPAISSNEIARIRVPFPDAELQSAIADFLDHETAEIDEFIADFARLIDLTREHTQAHISRLMSPSQQDGNHTTTQLGRVIRINQGQVDPQVSPFSSWPLIAPNHIEPRTGRLLEVPSAKAQAAESGKYLVKEGQIVYSKIRPALMKATRVDFSALSSADMYAMDANPRWLSNDYLLEYLLSPLFENYAVTMSDRVAMPKLNRVTLSHAPIIIPEPTVQKEIVRAARESRRKHQALENDVNIAIDLARERRVALISAVVTGQIEVTQKRKPVAELLEDEVGVRA